MLSIKFDENLNKKEFSKLKNNETFIVDDELYIKVNTRCMCAEVVNLGCSLRCPPDDSRMEEVNCIKLSNMEFIYVDADVLVEVVRCELTVKKELEV